jgi:3-oxoacyl-[acyl-carrier-protein] synthase II
LSPTEIVITGIGIVSPIGTGRERFWEALLAGRSGVRRITLFDPSGLPVQIAGEVSDFDPKPYLRQRKTLKIMCRDSQMGVAAGKLACDDASLAEGGIDPERFGVVLGADRICNPVVDSEPAYRKCTVDGQFRYDLWGTEGLAASFPLSFLRVLPNMIACHVSIAQDARGPNNTIHQGDVSALLAVHEAARVIERGMADVMIAGGASSQMDAYDWVRHCGLGGLSRRQGDPASASRPFDADRDGQVRGEGAAALVFESRRHAESRGATILARLLGWGSGCEPVNGDRLPQGASIRRAMTTALDRAGLDCAGLGHIHAHGLGKVEEDRIEAQAIHAVAPATPVTAAKSFFGNLAAAGGAVEMAASVLSVATGTVPVTLNYQRPDPQCPVEVIHGRPLESAAATALVINWTPAGQAAAIVVGGPK